MTLLNSKNLWSKDLKYAIGPSTKLMTAYEKTYRAAKGKNWILSTSRLSQRLTVSDGVTKNTGSTGKTRILKGGGVEIKQL